MRQFFTRINTGIRYLMTATDCPGFISAGRFETFMHNKMYSHWRMLQ
ncbi:hypothetical protein [Pectobacterium aroidearum]